MGGGLLQLVAYGAQDVSLTGNPQITFFHTVFRRHTNFAIQTIEQTLNGNFKSNGRISFNISRDGDLLNELFPYIVLFFPNLAMTLKILFDSKTPILPDILNATGTVP